MNISDIGKKNISAFAILFTAVSAMVLLIVYKSDLLKNFGGQFGVEQNLETTNYMVNGRIVEVKNNSIVVEGMVRSLDEGALKRETRTIEFAFTSSTAIKKTRIVIPEDSSAGIVYFPKTEETEGSRTDLVVGRSVNRLHSKENLFKVDKATLVNINYEIF